MNRIDVIRDSLEQEISELKRFTKRDRFVDDDSFWTVENAIIDLDDSVKYINNFLNHIEDSLKRMNFITIDMNTEWDDYMHITTEAKLKKAEDDVYDKG